MAETIDVKANDIIKIMRGLSEEDQKYILKIIVDSIFPQKKIEKEKKRKPLLFPSPKMSDKEINKMKRKGIPSLGNIDEVVKKRKLKKEQLEPFKELFKDELSAEELIKLL